VYIQLCNLSFFTIINNTNQNNKTMKEFLKDYLNFWDKRTHDENGKRICKYPFTHWMITALSVSTIVIIISYA